MQEHLDWWSLVVPDQPGALAVTGMGFRKDRRQCFHRLVDSEAVALELAAQLERMGLSFGAERWHRGLFP